MAPKTHDYTSRGWGHDFIIDEITDGGLRLLMTGWGSGIQSGDYLLLPNRGQTTRYKSSVVRYYHAPTDMWSITAEFAPREEPIRPEQGIDRQGFRVTARDVAPEPHRNELLVALACLSGGVVLSVLIGILRWSCT